MPFRFSLEQVLEHRKSVEETRQREMAESQRQVDQVEDLLAQTREMRNDYRKKLAEEVQRGIPYAWREIYQNYLTALDRLIKRSESHLEQLKKELERRRALLIAASRQRHIMDELKKQEIRQYLLEEKRAERKAFDEIASRNFLMAHQENNAETAEGSTI